MGRTNPTYREFVRRQERRWKPFRRGLRRRYRADFDRLFEKAREHADAAGYANARDPELAMVLSILLAQERELRELRERVRGQSASRDRSRGTPRNDRDQSEPREPPRDRPDG